MFLLMPEFFISGTVDKEDSYFTLVCEWDELAGESLRPDYVRWEEHYPRPDFQMERQDYSIDWGA